MSVYTDPDTGATIRRSRSRRTTETVQLRIPEYLDEMYLSDLRQLDELAAHLPGDALVQPREYGVDITYTLIDEDDEQSLIDEPSVDGPEDDATDRERDRLVGL